MLIKYLLLKKSKIKTCYFEIILGGHSSDRQKRFHTSSVTARLLLQSVYVTEERKKIVIKCLPTQVCQEKKTLFKVKILITYILLH